MSSQLRRQPVLAPRAYSFDTKNSSPLIYYISVLLIELILLVSVYTL